MFVCLCLTSHRQRGHLETAPHLLSLSKDVKLGNIYCSNRESNPGPSRGSPLRYRCATQAPHKPLGVMVLVMHSIIESTNFTSSRSRL